MPACELRPATQYDTDAVYALICELTGAQLTLKLESAGIEQD